MLEDLLKRARLAKVHALILDTLHSEILLVWFKKTSKQQELLDTLPRTFSKVAEDYGIHMSEFPDLGSLKDALARHDFSKFNRIDQKKLNALEIMLATGIPELY